MLLPIFDYVCFTFLQVQVATQTQPTMVVSHPNVASMQAVRGTIANQFGPNLTTLVANDVSINATCTLTSQQQTHQPIHQGHAQQLQQQQLSLAAPPQVTTSITHQALAMPAPINSNLPSPMVNASILPQDVSNSISGSSSGAAKIPGGIAKKVIDKQSRKERNRYTLLKQSAAGTQGNLMI